MGEEFEAIHGGFGYIEERDREFHKIRFGLIWFGFVFFSTPFYFFLFLKFGVSNFDLQMS